MDPMMDEAQDRATLAGFAEQVRQALGFVLEKLNAMADRQEALEKLVVEDLIGGLSAEGDRLGRAKLGGFLREKMPGFGKYSGYFQGVHGRDVFDDATDRLWPEVGKLGGWDDAKILDVAKALLAAYDTGLGPYIRETEPAPAEAGDEPGKEIEIEVKSEAPSAAPDEFAGLTPAIAAVLKREKAVKKGAD